MDIPLDPHHPLSVNYTTSPCLVIPSYVPTKTIPIPKYSNSTAYNSIPIKSSPRSRSASLVKYSPPTDYSTVEYDMDDQDSIFATNESIPFDFLEFSIDFLEKEFFNMLKYPQANAMDDSLPYPDDITCSVCDDGECENTNAIVFCDGCNIPVHQDCYGIPFIPEGPWLCRKCLILPESDVSCIFCPNTGGAFKQTSSNKWCHLLCAFWIPECYLSNYTFMEPVEGEDDLPPNRWKLVCSICNVRSGACIQCSKKSCFTAFHVTCARKALFYMKMRTVNSDQHQQDFKCYCDKHAPKELKDTLDVHAALVNAQKETRNHAFNSSWTIDNKSSTADILSSPSKKRKKQETKPNLPPKSYPTPYSVPSILLQKLINACKKFTIKNKDKTIIEICKYWSLKRDYKRGAPLLKRLRIEPWTANAAQHKEEEDKKTLRYEKMAVLRKDLDRVRNLSNLVVRREKEKLRQLNLRSQYLEVILYPLQKYLKSALDRIKRLAIFAEPVNTKLIPDYCTYVKSPMDFSTMYKKLENFQYTSVEVFHDDLNLICNNCMYYNLPVTIYYKEAQKLKILIGSVIKELKLELNQLKEIGYVESEEISEQIDAIFT